MTKNTVNQRFIDAINFLISSKKVKSKSEIAEKLQISAPKLSEILNSRMNAGIEILVLLKSKFGISLDWLLIGSGEMFKTYQQNDGIPLLVMEAFAGYGDTNVYGSELTRITDHYEIPLFKGLHVDFMISVKGSSMYPKYNSGDVVACQLINELNFIQWNKVYVIDTISQGVILKRLKPSKNEKFVLCKSDNESYDTFEIPKKEIRNIAMVVGVVRLE